MIGHTAVLDTSRNARSFHSRVDPDTDQGIESGVRVENTNADTDLYVVTIPGGTLREGGRIRGVFGGTLYNTSALAADFNVLFPWGDGYAVTAGAVQSISASPNPRLWRADCDGLVIADGSSLSAEDADTRFLSSWRVTSPASIGTESRTTQINTIGHGLSVRNLTDDNRFGIQVRMSVADPLVSIMLDFAHIEVIPA